MNTVTILIVDDDPDDVLIIADAIKELHPTIQIVSAVNGEIAMEMLTSHLDLHHSLSLIILDLNMPKMNGTQTLMALKENQKFEKIPVVIYSTSVNSLEKEKCLKLGALSYMTKPLSYKESIATAAHFIELCNTRSIQTGKTV